MPDEIMSSPGYEVKNIEFKIPEGLPRPFATNIVVQGGEHTVAISFFEAQPPILIGSPDQKAEQARKLQTIPAYCVATVVVAIEKLPGFIKVMQGIYDGIKKNQANKSSEASVS